MRLGAAGLMLFEFSSTFIHLANEKVKERIVGVPIAKCHF